MQGRTQLAELPNSTPSPPTNSGNFAARTEKPSPLRLTESKGRLATPLAPKVRHLPILSVARRLEQQQTLTAVDAFSRSHETDPVPDQAQYYRRLLPQALPNPGQQYAFEVDLDRCTGCKACVTACHSLNGLDESEMWRSVGLIQSKTASPARVQTVTSSCHHCVEPACLKGCPVGAYEKDPVTGIVKHLDDQCFGCQYCTLMCPYDAPKFNAERGIVRKCDMCSERLAVGEAPACVQACPNEAIRIQVVDKKTATELALAGNFIPGAPSPKATTPTTTYRSRISLPPDLDAVDGDLVRTEHTHLPLVFMLTLTQLSVGTLLISALFGRSSSTSQPAALLPVAVAFGFTGAALVASVFHLGRPLLAWRAVLNLKTSWLSREALSFGVFAKLLLFYLVSLIPPEIVTFAYQSRFSSLQVPLGVLAGTTGVIGVFCSVMVYVATGRGHWRASCTSIKFFGSLIVLGTSTVAMLEILSPSAGVVHERTMALTLSLLLAFGIWKLLWEARRLRTGTSTDFAADRLMARIMLLRMLALVKTRFALGILGILLLPSVQLFANIPAAASQLCAVAGFIAALGGELMERVMFFRAAPGSRMPGGV